MSPEAHLQPEESFVATYGVLAFLIEDGTADTRVVLYRHSAASQAAPPIDTTPPAVPSGLSVR